MIQLFANMLQTLACLLCFGRKFFDYIRCCTTTSRYFLDENNHSELSTRLQYFCQLHTLFSPGTCTDFKLYSICVWHSETERDTARLYNSELHTEAF
jgi:hypothetical protein